MKHFLTASTTSLILLTVSLYLPKESLADEIQPPEFEATAFQALECRRIDNKYVTVAITRNNTVTPFMIGRTREFTRAGYTPQRRCREVTGKLREAIGNNGGFLSGLLLTTGRVDNYRVLCQVSNTNADCNDNNFLFHLSRQNRSNPSKLIAKLLNFSINVTDRSEPIIE